MTIFVTFSTELQQRYLATQRSPPRQQRPEHPPPWAAQVLAFTSPEQLRFRMWK